MMFCNVLLVIFFSVLHHLWTESDLFSRRGFYCKVQFKKNKKKNIVSSQLQKDAYWHKVIRSWSVIEKTEHAFHRTSSGLFDFVAHPECKMWRVNQWMMGFRLGVHSQVRAGRQGSGHHRGPKDPLTEQTLPRQTPSETSGHHAEDSQRRQRLLETR